MRISTPITIITAPTISGQASGVAIQWRCAARGCARTARLVRAQFLSLREREFVLAARCLGAGSSSIIVTHILPNVIAPLIAVVTFGVGGAILTEAGLSFLGLGVAEPTPSWGNMLNTARALDILQNLPWMWIPPAIIGRR